MADEIIARLRVATVADSANSIYQTMTEAADEIERLRAELEVRNNQYSKLEIEVADWQRTVRALEAELRMAEKWRNNYEKAFKDSQDAVKYWHKVATLLREEGACHTCQEHDE